MDTKEKVLNDKLSETGHNMETLTILRQAVYEAMDIHARNCMIEFLVDTHARNCMIEFLVWYDEKGYATTKEQAERIVDGFLQSEYYKELQK